MKLKLLHYSGKSLQSPTDTVWSSPRTGIGAEAEVGRGLGSGRKAPLHSCRTTSSEPSEWDVEQR